MSNKFEWQGVENLVPSNLKKVHIFISSDYMWGSGWTASQAERFYNAVYPKLKEKFWVEPRHDDYDCEHLHLMNHNGYRDIYDKTDLYLHPMDFSGFASQETIDVIKEQMEGLENVALIKDIQIDNTQYYDMSDEDYQKLMAKNIIGIKEYIESLPKGADPGECFAKECRLPRVGDHEGLSSLDTDWHFINNIDIMLKELGEYQREEEYSR